MVRGNTLVVANAGDSRCVCSRAGTAVAMTQDHKPTDAEEHARIMRVSASRRMWQKVARTSAEDQAVGSMGRKDLGEELGMMAALQTIPPTEPQC